MQPFALLRQTGEFLVQFTDSNIDTLNKGGAEISLRQGTHQIIHFIVALAHLCLNAFQRIFLFLFLQITFQLFQQLIYHGAFIGVLHQEFAYHVVCLLSADILAVA